MMTTNSNRNAPLLAAALAMLCFPASRAIGQQSSPTEAALANMRAIEEEIEIIRVAESDRRARIGELDEQLRIAEEFLMTDARVRLEGFATIDAVESDLGRQLENIKFLIDDENEKLEVVATKLTRGAPLLLFESRRRDPTHLSTLVLALNQKHHRTRAHQFTGKLLDLKSDEARIGLNRSRLIKQDLVSNNSGIEKIAALRQRHRDLAAQMESLGAESQLAQNNVADLQAARAALDQFITALAPSSPRKPVRDPDRGRGRPILPPNLNDISVLPEVPDERLDPLDSIPDADELDSSRLEGYRRIFWRASEVRIHAIGAGKVLFSGPFSGYDHLLVIDQGEGWTVVIGNLSSSLLAEGAVVGKNQVMGEYAAAAGSGAKPLWIEVRYGVDTVPIERLPGIDQAWANRLFGR